MRRRSFLKIALTVGSCLTLKSPRAFAANEEIRLGVIGIGSNVKIGGKGRQDIRDFRAIPGVRVAAVCDCDTDHLDWQVDQFRKWGESVKAHRDYRRILDDPEIDAISITTPNHWHSLMAIQACQAGKHVFVQKPMSHNLFEGRQVVSAAQKYDRVVQATHGPRNSGNVQAAFEYARSGELGAIRCVRGLNYRSRESIGLVDGPQPIPPTCDYDLWCGPAPKKRLMREYLHYDWHWDWDTGNGDLGNMGIHYMDACRWALGANSLPRRVMTLGARVGYRDDGQTPNTLVTILDYQPAPILFEVRGLPIDAEHRDRRWGRSMDQYLGTSIGTVVHCEGGTVRIRTGDVCAAFDNDGRKICDFSAERVSTKQNFIDAIRNPSATPLHTDAVQGHLSCGLVHMTNISYRLGREADRDVVRETVAGQESLQEATDRMLDHLHANQIDLELTPLTLGPTLTLDPTTEQFTGEFSERANQLATRTYREPFVVADQV